MEELTGRYSIVSGLDWSFDVVELHLAIHNFHSIVCLSVLSKIARIWLVSWALFEATVKILYIFKTQYLIEQINIGSAKWIKMILIDL